MHKHYIFLTIILSTCARAQETTTNDEPRILVEQIVLQTIINQKSNHEHTLPKFGAKLIHYLNNLDNETFETEFIALPYRAKIKYMLEMDTQEYEFFLERFNDKQWETFWSKLTPEEQQHIPKTKTEQLTIIRNAYRAYCKHICGWFSMVEKASPYPSDLKKFKKKFYKDPNPQGEYMSAERIHERHNFLYAHMAKERFKLFNI